MIFNKNSKTLTMKKALIIAAFVAALFITEKAQAQLNIHMGYSPELMTRMTPTYDTLFLYHGLCLGLDWTFVLKDNFSLSVGPQFRLNLRDVSKHYWSGAIYVHDLYRDRQTLIDLPILLKYKFPVSDKFAISPFAGPMLSCGIKGKTSRSISFPLNTEQHYEWYGDDGYMKRFNVYGMVGVEMCFKRFTFSLGGRYGFLNLSKNTDETIKAYSFFINFGHSF